ncbi:uncharacterized protein LOC131242779 [Magnolia sinica]|uniref:uncharacterized protein LOC131242779 n=1 Tax=Magnolia sinica TaxID=86752 RepID=UPI002659EF45|nr:uncharacterized protein LOC131242779 [Magnolia sinica]
MADSNEEKSLGEECLGSLEEKISDFFSESSNGSNCTSLDDDEEESSDPAEREEFWLGQESLLQEILSRSNLTGSKLRREVSRAMKMTKETVECRCPKPSSNRCAICLRRAVIDHLHTVGYDAALCTSTWRSTREIPGGKHEYIDVIVHATDRKKEARFVIELDFRVEFEMAKACEDYQKLITHLPESFVGKPEHLNTVLSVVCGACKRSMRERKIYMGPWRKRKFMLKKWAGSQRRWFSDLSPAVSVQSKELLMPIHTFSLCSAAVEVA